MFVRRSAGNPIWFRTIRFLGLGLLVASLLTEAKASDGSGIPPNDDILVITGTPSQAQAQRYPDGPSATQFSLGVVDPAADMEPVWIAPLPPVHASDWLGIFNGAFYYVSPEEHVLYMLHLETGALQSLGVVAHFHHNDGQLVVPASPGEAESDTRILDLRRRVRRTAIAPEYDPGYWRKMSMSPDGCFQLFTRLHLEEGGEALVLSLRLYNLPDGHWSETHEARLPLYTLPVRISEGEGVDGKSSLTLSGGDWDHDALLPIWHHDHLLVVRAPLGIGVPTQSPSAPVGLGLWVIDAATNLAYPLKLESGEDRLNLWDNENGGAPATAAGNLLEAPRGGPEPFRLFREASVYRAVSANDYDTIEPIGPYYSLFSSKAGIGWRCGIVALPGGVEIYRDERNRAEMLSRLTTSLVAPSGTRMVFGDRLDLVHSLGEGSTPAARPGGQPLAWCAAGELRHTPSSAATGEVPFVDLATEVRTLPHGPQFANMLERRSITRELRLEASLPEDKRPKALVRVLKLTLTNTGIRTLHLLGPDVITKLRGTIVTPSTIEDLANLALPMGDGDAVKALLPGGSIEGSVTIETREVGEYIVVPGYRTNDSPHGGFTISALPLRFSVEGAARDPLDGRLRRLIKEHIVNAPSAEIYGAILQEGFTHAPERIETIQSNLDRVRAKSVQSAEELALYPRQARAALKDCIATEDPAGPTASYHFTNLYTALGEIATYGDFAFLFARLEEGHPNELNGIVEFLGAYFRRGQRPEAPFDELLFVVRRLQVKYPEAGRNALLSFLYRMPDRYDAEDLVRPLLGVEQHASEARAYLLGHRASRKLPLDEETIRIARASSEAADGRVHWGLVRTLGAFYAVDPDAQVVRDLIDSLLPENREAIHRTIPAYGLDGAGWLRNAAAHPTRERLEHARILIVALEERSSTSNGSLPAGAWSEVEKAPEALTLFSTTLLAWADYLDRNKVEVPIP